VPSAGHKSEAWWVMTGSNCRPSPCKGDALPTELITRKIYQKSSIAFFREHKFDAKKYQRNYKFFGIFLEVLLQKLPKKFQNKTPTHNCIGVLQETILQNLSKLFQQ
jgi:hypothetical protein